MKNEKTTYYHGTWAGYGQAIMTRGFELGHEGRGNLLGRGVYIAQTLDAAALWTLSDFIITCSLLPGTRILWVDETYERRVIRYLEREFGRELIALGPHFHRAIPRNKRLTQSELIQLCAYTLMRARRKRYQYVLHARKGKKATYFDSWLCLSRLHEQVKRHGYDALGDRSLSHWDSDEILVFNPSLLVPISAPWLFREGEFPKEERFSLSKPIPEDSLGEISTAAQQEEEMEDHE
jgi:hypothetical protein